LGARLAPSVGVLVDQSRTAIDVPLALQSATLDLTQIGVNASVDKGPWTWAIALVHGFGKINSSRDTGSGIASYNAHIDDALTELSYYWSMDQSRIVPKAAFEYVRATTGSVQEVGGLNPEMASGSTVERSRILLGAEVGHYWIFDRKVFDLSAYGKFVDNVSQNFSSVTVSLGTESITLQGIGESGYGADAGASASLNLSNTARLYLNYDGKFRAAMQSHQGTLGRRVEVVAQRIGGARCTNQSSSFAPSERFGSYIPVQSEICSRSSHEGHKIVWVNKFIPEARVGFGIEDLFKPIDDDLVPFRATKLLVISKPKVGMVVDA